MEPAATRAIHFFFTSLPHFLDGLLYPIQLVGSNQQTEDN